MIRPDDWESMTDIQRLCYRLGYAAGLGRRWLFPVPHITPPEPERRHGGPAKKPPSSDLTRHAVVKQWAGMLEGTEDIVEMLRAVPHPPKERP